MTAGFLDTAAGAGGAPTPPPAGGKGPKPDPSDPLAALHSALAAQREAAMAPLQRERHGTPSMSGAIEVPAGGAPAPGGAPAGQGGPYWDLQLPNQKKVESKAPGFLDTAVKGPGGYKEAAALDTKRDLVSRGAMGSLRPWEGGTRNIEEATARIAGGDSALMRRAAFMGEADAARRGLLDSSVATEAAQAAVLDQASRIAEADERASIERGRLESERQLRGRGLDIEEGRLKLSQDELQSLDAHRRGQLRYSYDELAATQQHRQQQLQLSYDELQSLDQWRADQLGLSLAELQSIDRYRQEQIRTVDDRLEYDYQQLADLNAYRDAELGIRGEELASLDKYRTGQLELGQDELASIDKYREGQLELGQAELASLDAWRKAQGDIQQQQVDIQQGQLELGQAELASLDAFRNGQLDLQAKQLQEQIRTADNAEDRARATADLARVNAYQTAYNSAWAQYNARIAAINENDDLSAEERASQLEAAAADRDTMITTAQDSYKNSLFSDGAGEEAAAA